MPSEFESGQFVEEKKLMNHWIIAESKTEAKLDQ